MEKVGGKDGQVVGEEVQHKVGNSSSEGEDKKGRKEEQMEELKVGGAPTEEKDEEWEEEGEREGEEGKERTERQEVEGQEGEEEEEEGYSNYQAWYS